MTQSMVVTGLFFGHNILRRRVYLMGLNSSPYIEGVEQRKKPQPTFCVSGKVWVRSDIQIRAATSWTQRMLKSLSLGVIWNF